MPVFGLEDVAAIGEWAALECEAQETNPLAVGYMIRAYCSNTAQKIAKVRKVYPSDLLNLGRMVLDMTIEFRHIPVTFRDGGTAIPAQNVKRTVASLCNAWNGGRLSVDEFYQEFEEIHPFIDGNGRTGNIVYNLLLNGYAAVSRPPEFQKKG